MSENVIQFNKVRGKYLNHDDKRLHPRLENDDRLFTQVVLLQISLNWSAAPLRAQP